jgi:hypothetical protein
MLVVKSIFFVILKNHNNKNKKKQYLKKHIKNSNNKIKTSLINFLPHSTTGIFSIENAVNTADARAPKKPYGV